MKQTSHHRDTEAPRTEKKEPFLCASVSLWLMQSIFSQLLLPVSGHGQDGHDTGGASATPTQQNAAPLHYVLEIKWVSDGQQEF